MDNKKEEKKSEEKIELPKGIDATISKSALTLKGAKNHITKKFLDPRINIKVENNQIIIQSVKSSKREKKIIGTFRAVIKNMIRGVTQPYRYTLKICSGHFPMNVSVNKDELVIKNFFGEKNPRILKIKEGVTAKVDGDLIDIEGVDKELCGQVAAEIEKITSRTAYDKRIFQDGIFIIKKDEKEIQ